MTPATPRPLTVSPAFTAQLRVVAERDALLAALRALVDWHDVRNHPLGRYECLDKPFKEAKRLLRDLSPKEKGQ